MLDSDRTPRFLPFLTAALLAAPAAAQWFPVPGFAAPDVTAIGFSPAFVADQTIFVGTYGNGVQKHTAAGWAAANKAKRKILGIYMGTKDLTDIEAIAVSPAYAADQTAFCGTVTRGVFRTDDGGNTWYQKKSGLSALHVHGIAVSPDFAVDQTVFCTTYATSNSIYRSTDRGDTWTVVSAVGNAGGIAISPAFVADRAMISARWNGVASNLLLTSARTGAGPLIGTFPGLQVEVVAVTPNFVVDRLVFAGTLGAGLWFRVL